MYTLADAMLHKIVKYNISKIYTDAFKLFSHYIQWLKWGGSRGGPRPPASGTDPLLKDKTHLLQVQTPLLRMRTPLLSVA